MQLPWESLVSGVVKIADDLVTTDKERLQLALEDKKIDAALAQGQIDTNKIEAASPSVFVAGWRPMAGWVCSGALAVTYIPKALVMTGIWMWQAIVIMNAWNGVGAPPAVPLFPDLGVTDLIGLLTALLGLSATRSFDKLKETDTKQMARLEPAG